MLKFFRRIGSNVVEQSLFWHSGRRDGRCLEMPFARFSVGVACEVWLLTLGTEVRSSGNRVKADDVAGAARNDLPFRQFIAVWLSNKTSTLMY